MEEYVFIKMNEDLYNSVSKITNTDYEKKGDYMPLDYVESMIEDLLYEIDRLKEKIEDIENDIESNYRPISNKEMFEDGIRFN